VTDTSIKTVDYADSLLAHRAAAVNPAPGPSAPRDIISFIYGLPAEEAFPAQEIGEAAVWVMREQYTAALQYNHPRTLVEYLVNYIEKDQGLKLNATNILMTNGSSNALGLMCRLMIDPGDVVVVEAPTFLGAVSTFRKNEAEIAEVPMDDEGMDVDALEKVLAELKAAGKKVKFIYTIPTFQNPTGVTMGLERRKRMLELAEQYQTLILEDDAYHGLVFEGEVPPWLWTLDTKGLVIHCGTFSKTLAAGMRLGWMGGPADLLARVAALKDDGGTSPFSGYIAAKFAENGRLEKHTQVLIDLYRRKRDRMLAGLERYMPEGVRWTNPTGGFFIWVELPESVDTGKMLSKAMAAGVNYLPGTACFAGGKGTNCIRLAFSFVKLEQIEPGMRKLGEIITAEMES
jgi:2-aminoadipate transaminase